MELLIPFGISNKTNELIEPENAINGRKCNCRCPGCDMPLLSRHPKNIESRKHFAHDSRHPDAVESAIKECPFNRWLAVSIMARHLSDSFKGESINFPELIKYVGCDICLLESKVKVTEQSHSKIDFSEAEYRKFGSVFDLRLVLGRHDVLVWLSYKNRPFPLITDNQLKELETTGILEIDVNSFSFTDFSKGAESFVEYVGDFVLQSGEREWVYHPRASVAVIAESQKHKCIREYSARPPPKAGDVRVKPDAIDHAIRNMNWKHRTNSKPINPVKYQCVLCKAEWVKTNEGDPECPNGCGYLCSRTIG